MSPYFCQFGQQRRNDDGSRRSYLRRDRGNWAAAVTLWARDEKGTKIAYQVLVYPAVQYGLDTPSAFADAEGFLLHRASMECFWKHYVRSPNDGKNPYCSPLAAEDHSGLPVKFRLYEGMIHGFLRMFGVLAQSRALADEIGLEVRATLG